MALPTAEYSTEQLSAIAAIVTTTTLTMWFLSDLSGIQRVTSTGFAFLAAIAGTLVGFRLFGLSE